MTRLRLIAALFLAAPAAAQQRLPLWDHGVPGFERRAAIPEVARDYWTKHVNNPSVTAYLPAPARATGTAVVGVPGGGHSLLVTTTEGTDVARWLNDRGVAVGYSTVTPGDFTINHGFVTSGNTMIDVGTLPGGTSSFAYAINDDGVVVGSSFGSAFGYIHAFVDRGGTLTDLNALVDPTSGWTLLAATGINDRGQITGFGFNPQGVDHLGTAGRHGLYGAGGGDRLCAGRGGRVPVGGTIRPLQAR